MSMNPVAKKKWLEVLRSGEYTQGQTALNHDGTFCCLGVLCDVYLKETGDPNSEWESNEEVYFTTKDPNGQIIDSSLEFLPMRVMGWAGLGEQNPPIVPKTGSSPINLADLNDGIGCVAHSFTEIADIIEEQL